MTDKNIINAQKSHRQLSDQQLKLMSELTEVGESLNVILVAIAASESLQADTRWLNIGKTHLQQGLMAVKRAVANPDFF